MNQPTCVSGKKLYKVLSGEGESQNSGHLKWSLPEDGRPGEWHETPRALMCLEGLHLTTTPTKWWPSEHSRVFEVEAEGFQLQQDGQVLFADEGDKVVARRVRLLREITEHAELATIGVFKSGTHEVRDGVCIAYGSSAVTAYGSSAVTANDSSRVTANDSSRVTAYGSSAVTAYDSSRVTAYGSSAVTAYGSSRVTANGQSNISINHCPYKYNAGVKATLSDKACLVDRRKDGKPVFEVAS